VEAMAAVLHTRLQDLEQSVQSSLMYLFTILVIHPNVYPKQPTAIFDTCQDGAGRVLRASGRCPQPKL
jgi:hypothetical protein